MEDACDKESAEARPAMLSPSPVQMPNPATPGPEIKAMTAWGPESARRTSPSSLTEYPSLRLASMAFTVRGRAVSHRTATILVGDVLGVGLDDSLADGPVDSLMDAEGLGDSDGGVGVRPPPEEHPARRAAASTTPAIIRTLGPYLPSRFPAQGLHWRSPIRQTPFMARKLLAALTALAAVFAVGVSLAAPASADPASDLRDRAYARVSVIADDAVSMDVYSADQANYIAGAILPAYLDPKDLPNRVEARTIDSFWAIMSDGADMSEEQVQGALRRGRSLNLIMGDNAGEVRNRLYSWLSRPVVQAQLNGDISFAESQDLRNDIERAAYRFMAQPGGGRDVVLVPRRA